MSKRKLLLADDSITIQKVVNLTFADEGIEVISVGDGDSAMRKFDEFMPDLVMADVNMPGLNGYEVCRIIKNTEETQHIPVILLVGSFEPFDEAEARDAGADDFLTKPFQSIRQLVNKVTELLNQSEKSATDAAYTENPPPSVVDTFAETLAFEKQQEFENRHEEQPTEFESRREEISSEFGDAGMDDEMIETSPANEYVSDSSAGHQAETTIDYAQTQPLNADDLKGFSIVPVESAAAETRETPEDRELAAEMPERAEAATFDEEARKLGGNYGYEQSEPQEKPEVIAETEPQVDYYLPTAEENREEPTTEETTTEEFEKEMSDAETLAPEVAYSAEQPREADFSQTETVSETETEEPAVEETGEAAETPYPAEETGSADFYKPETAEEPAGDTYHEFEKAEGSSETSFVEAPQTAETIEETAIESAEETGGYSTGEAETEAAQTELAETELAETQEAETQEAETGEAETSRETPAAAASSLSPLNFDEGDLLELPPLVEETGIRPQPVVQPLKSEPEPAEAVTPAEPEEEAVVAAAAAPTATETETMQAFPPELIEAIAQKIADKISAQTMNDVLPQITELVMKKLAEEKMKE